MSQDDANHNQALLEIARRRLHVLELQAAQFGIYAPPHITIEIADIKKEIARLQGSTETTNAAQSAHQEPKNAAGQPQLSNQDMRRLVDLLLTTQSIANRGSRESIIQALPNNIGNAIIRNDNPRFDVMNIVRTSFSYPGGLAALIDEVSYYEGDSLAMKKINDFIASLPVA